MTATTTTPVAAALSVSTDRAPVTFTLVPPSPRRMRDAGRYTPKHWDVTRSDGKLGGFFRTKALALAYIAAQTAVIGGSN